MIWLNRIGPVVVEHGPGRKPIAQFNLQQTGTTSKPEGFLFADMEPDAPIRPPFASHSATSRAAAAAIEHAAPTVRHRVLAYLVSCGPDGSTDEQCQLALGLRVQSETARRNELCKLGLVCNSGKTRLTSAGRAASVWIAVER